MALNTVRSVTDDADDEEATSEDNNAIVATRRREVLLRLVLVVVAITAMVIEDEIEVKCVRAKSLSVSEKEDFQKGSDRNHE